MFIERVCVCVCVCVCEEREILMASFLQMSSQLYDPKDITTPTPQVMATLIPIIPSGQYDTLS